MRDLCELRDLVDRVLDAGGLRGTEAGVRLPIAAYLHGSSGLASSPDGSLVELEAWVDQYVATDAPSLLATMLKDWAEASRSLRIGGSPKESAVRSPAPGKEMADLLMTSGMFPRDEDWSDAVAFLRQYYDQAYITEFLGYPAFVYGNLYADVDAADWSLPQHRVRRYDRLSR